MSGNALFYLLLITPFETKRLLDLVRDRKFCTRDAASIFTNMIWNQISKFIFLNFYFGFKYLDLLDLNAHDSSSLALFRRLTVRQSPRSDALRSAAEIGSPMSSRTLVIHFLPRGLGFEQSSRKALATVLGQNPRGTKSLAGKIPPIWSARKNPCDFIVGVDKIPATPNACFYNTYLYVLRFKHKINVITLSDKLKNVQQVTLFAVIGFRIRTHCYVSCFETMQHCR